MGGWVRAVTCDQCKIVFQQNIFRKKNESFLVNVLLRVLGKVVRPALPSQPEHVDAVVVVRLKQTNFLRKM